MKHHFFIISCLMLLCICSAGYAYSPREVINLNREWKYMEVYARRLPGSGADGI